MAGNPRQPISAETLAPQPVGGRTLVDVDPATLDPTTLRLKADTIASTPTLVTGLDADLEGADPATRYETRTLLGEGGMGEVRQCHDGHIGRDVAMKVIRPERGARGDFRARFLREARVQGQLEHPSVPPVYDLGQDGTGAMFFTMRRVRGETLESILARMREREPKAIADYPRHRLLAAFARVCLAAHYAHTKGVVHRDLKPANVMLGDYGEVYVLDWGLARIVGRKAAPVEAAPPLAPGSPGVPGALPTSEPSVMIADESGAHTEIGAILGTPGYMPPEQILGQHDEIDARSDVYSLGVLLFELLAIEPLFPPDATASDLFNRALVGVDARPSIRAPERELPPELDAICVKATQPAPEARHATARELHDAVDRYLAGDRDIEQRRMLAASHVGKAQAASRRALSADGSDDDRKEALREAGRALALEPENDHAVRVLLELVTTTPRHVPSDVVEAVTVQERATARRFFLTGAAMLALSAAFVFVPALLTMGVIRPLFAWGIPALWVVAALGNLLAYLRRSPSTVPWTQPLVMMAVMSTAALFGPFVFVPAVSVAVTAAFMATGHRRFRLMGVASGCLAIAVPAALEWAGVVAPSYAIDGAGIHLLPRVVRFPPSFVTHGALLLSQLASVVAVAYYVGRHRERLVAAQVRNQLQVWHLRHLVPDEAKGALAPGSRSPTSAHLAAAIDAHRRR